jgi:predicted nucleotidyltransferase
VTSDTAVTAVIETLQHLHVPFMIVGSLATNFHGVPRSTRDADFVVQLTPDALREISAHLGDRFRLQPQTSFETITGTTRHVFRLAKSPFIVELFELTDDPHDVERFARRQRVQVFGQAAFVATAEDTIVTKLRWARHGHRTKDIEDVRNVIAVQQESLDWDYIRRWCTTHGTADLLDQIRASTPAL